MSNQEKHTIQSKEKKVGRPKLDIDPEQVTRLARLHCTMQEMASFFGCHVDTLRDNFSKEIDKGKWIATTFTLLTDAAAVTIGILARIYFTKEGFAKHFKDETGTYEVDADIQFEHPTRTAHNVVAFIDNHAKNTIILGAHLDHLGYNQDKNALDIIEMAFSSQCFVIFWSMN